MTEFTEIQHLSLNKEGLREYNIREIRSARRVKRQVKRFVNVVKLCAQSKEK